jgi:NodT family efflux transporter outer membrane factor (OMF) lipoprotein
MKKIALWTLLPLAPLLCGCTLGPDFVLPDTHPAPTYAAAGDAPPPSDQRIVLGRKIEGDWWTAFHSPALDGVIKLAISDNLDIATAKARVAQAQEEVNAAEGALLPQVSLSATAGRQKYGVALFGPANFTIPPFTYYSVGPTLNFPLDLFGGQKRTVEEQAALKQYQGYELDAAYLSLTANVTARALAVAAAQAQIAVLQGIVQDDQRNLALVQTAFNAGSVARTQILTAQSQLANDKTLMPDVQQQQSVARHALAVLAGRAPAEWTPPAFTLADFALPAEIPVSLPSELVHQRPDILAAESQLHAASAAIGVATANLYPKINLTGTFMQEALTPGGLFNGAAAAWSIAAGLTQPLFDGGQLSAERRAAVDNYQAALATYRQTLLTAFGEVADRLQALANDADAVRAQTEAAQAAADSLGLQRRSFSAGNSGILDVIDAQRSSAQAQIGLARAKAQRLQDTALLYMALGGTPVSPDNSSEAGAPGQPPPAKSGGHG